MLPRTYVLFVVASLSVAVPAQAQMTPADYRLLGSLDIVVDSATGSQDTFTVGTPIWYSGWNGECRSGLQPQTQRVGTFSIRYSRVDRIGAPQKPPVLAPFTVQRPDAAAALTGDCPAIGPNIGYWLLAPGPTEAGDWYVSLFVTTTDGAGRQAIWESESRIITVSPAPTAASKVR